ncbi:MAG: hypothetical protein E7A81_00465 [Clostridiales bacterium]|nr:hypothetical protein [Clostridiales bacterium]MDU1041612.1 hypothetical protein [Clostridiales bacterium]
MKKFLNIVIALAVVFMVMLELMKTAPVSAEETSLSSLITTNKTASGLNADLLAGKKLLDDDTGVLDSRQHLVLITDGATYLYSKNNDFNTSYTKSFGDPKLQTNPKTGAPFQYSNDKKGGIWEYQSREYNVADFNGTNFLKYMTRNTEGLSPDFVELQKAVSHLIDTGSSVEDEIGKDFDFVNDPGKISLNIGDEVLKPVNIAEGQYGFRSRSDGTYRYVLTYSDNGVKETLLLNINETVKTEAPVKLNYS